MINEECYSGEKNTSKIVAWGATKISTGGLEIEPVIHGV